MLNIVLFLVDLFDQYIIWVYAICLVFVLYHARNYWLARRDHTATIYTIEREVASGREGRAMTNIGLVLGIAVVATSIKYYVLPTLDIEAIVEATPTVTLAVPTREMTVTPTPEPATPTPRPRPTRQVVATEEPPTATPIPLPICADPNTCLSYPPENATLSGSVTLLGTADHGQFQFYKVEYGLGEEPTTWHVISDIHHERVINGTLETFDTTSLPNGVYKLKLTVVDVTSNFPPPHVVRIVIEN